MAADAIARQYDVDKNRVLLICETDKGSYRPGTVTFYPKKGKSIDLGKMEESLRATRLSGGTSMSVDSLEITATGTVMTEGDAVHFKVAGTNQLFVLKDAAAKDGATKTLLQRLRDVASLGAPIVTVTGRVEGWSGRFPAVLNALGKQPADAPTGLVVAGFEVK